MCSDFQVRANRETLKPDFTVKRSFFIQSYIYKVITVCVCVCVYARARARARACVCVEAVQENPTDSYAVFTIGVSMQENLTDSYAVFTMYRCNINTHIRVLYLQDIGAELMYVCLIDSGSITLSRGRFVLARRVSVAERITRELDGAAKLRDYTA